MSNGQIVKQGSGAGNSQALTQSKNITELQAIAEEIRLTAEVFGMDEREVKHLQRAYLLSTSASGLVPDAFRGDYRAIYIMSQLADGMGIPLIECLQGGYIVYGKWAWSAEFMIKRVLAIGIFTAMDYESGGDMKDGTAWMRAIGTRPDGSKATGSTVSLAMARAEGWYDKKGSKWNTMPAVMLRKRAATFLIRECAPHAFGGNTLEEDEARDAHAPQTVAPGQQVIEAGAGNAVPVMTQILQEQQQSTEEHQRQEVLQRVEKKILDKYKTGDDILALEQEIGMSLETISNLKMDQLLAVWEIVK